jgi:iron complex outermembrane receptor protein
MRLRGSATIQDLEYASGQKLLNSPRWLGKLNLSAPLPWGGLRAGLEWQYDSQRLTLDGSSLGGYGIVNLHLSTHRLARGVEATLTVRNLLDKRYAHPGADTNWQNAFEQDGPGARVGLVWSI